jgi:hypothetical protein
MDDKNARVDAERIVGRADEQMSSRAPESARDPVPLVHPPSGPATSPLYVPQRTTHTPATAASASAARTAEVPAAAKADADEDDSGRTRQIRTEIEQTREEMSQTVNAIQERLRPATIAANAAESVRTGAQNLADSPGLRYVREYPLPSAALACGVAGLAWLALSSRSGPSAGSHGARAARYPSGPAGRARTRARGVDDAGQEFQASSWTVEDWGGPASQQRSRRAVSEVTAPPHHAPASRRQARRVDQGDHRFMIGAAAAAVAAVAAVTIAGPDRARSWVAHLRDAVTERIESAGRQLHADAVVDPTDSGPTTTLYEPDLPAGLTPETLVSDTVIVDRPLS